MRAPEVTAIWVLFGAASIAGCNTGSIGMNAGSGNGSTSDGGTAATVSARDSFASNVEPLLRENCVACHKADRTGPPFLAEEPDLYTTLMSYPALVDVSNPANSRLLTKGEHDGPAWTDTEASTIRAWIDLEAMERRGGATAGGDGGSEVRELATDPIDIAPGPQQIPLDSLGIDGAQISFTVQPVASGIVLVDLELTAAADGVRMVHPYLVVWESGVPNVDPVDRFAGVDMRVAPYASAPIGPGRASLVEFPEGGRISFLFDDLVATTGGGGTDADGGMGGGLGGGCNSVGSFTNYAQPAFIANCTRCHGGSNADATAAVDMQAMDDTSADGQLAACNEIKSRFDLSSPDSSNVFRASDPDSGLAHPFKFTNDADLFAFRTNVLYWLTTER